MNNHHDFDQVRALLSKAFADEPSGPLVDLSAILKRGRRKRAIRKSTMVAVTIASTIGAAMTAICLVIMPTVTPPASPPENPRQILQPLEPHTPDPEEARRLAGVLSLSERLAGDVG